MGQYVCRHVISFLLFSSTFIMLILGTITSGWYQDSNGINYNANGVSYDVSYRSTYQYLTGPARFSSAIYGCAATSTALAAIFMVLSFIMMCADCCCHVTKCLAVLPKVIISLATVAGILAEVACALLLAQIFNSDTFQTLYTALDLYFRPGFSFYLVAVSGLLLLIVGCVNCRMSYDTRVESLETAAVVVQGDQMQMQPQMNSFAYPMVPQGALMPAWGTGLAGPSPQYLTPGPVSMDNTPYYSNAPARIKVFVTHAETQTSQTNLKKAAK